MQKLVLEHDENPITMVFILPFTLWVRLNQIFGNFHTMSHGRSCGLSNLVDDVHEVSGVGEVTVVELQSHSALVTVPVDVIDSLGIEAGRSADDAVHLVPLIGKTRKKSPRRGSRGVQKKCQQVGRRINSVSSQNDT